MRSPYCLDERLPSSLNDPLALSLVDDGSETTSEPIDLLDGVELGLVEVGFDVGLGDFEVGNVEEGFGVGLGDGGEVK